MRQPNRCAIAPLESRLLLSVVATDLNFGVQGRVVSDFSVGTSSSWDSVGALEIAAPTSTASTDVLKSDGARKVVEPTSAPAIPRHARHHRKTRHHRN